MSGESVSCCFHVSRSPGRMPYMSSCPTCRALGPHSSSRGASYPSTAPSLHPGNSHCIHSRPSSSTSSVYAPTPLTHSPRRNGGHAPDRLSTPHKAQRASLATCIPPVWVSESSGGLPVSSVHRLPLRSLLQIKPRRTRRTTAGPWLMLCDG
jgi:hypothetical protein